MEVGACSFWEYQSAVNGWIETHAPEAEGKLSQEEVEDLWQLVEEG